ncbi:hypothetical protein L2E82_51161 [Cichorium intybus]|nr:hypothetical protein L2E82_51161 [Cichorium intybus]
MNVGGGRAPLAVTVFFGANDACLPDRYSAFQHVPIDEYRQNLHAIVAYLKLSMAEGEEIHTETVQSSFPV